MVSFGDGNELGDVFATEHALLAELLRRAGRFSEALEECQEGAGDGPERPAAARSGARAHALQAKDEACHSYEEFE